MGNMTSLYTAKVYVFLKENKNKSKYWNAFINYFVQRVRKFENWKTQK